MYNRQWNHPHGGKGCHGMMPYCCPPQTFPAQFDPPQISPTRQIVKTNIINTVVPHIHPTHTTTVNKHMINHEHYFPHTESVVNECYENHIMCEMPHKPCCPPKHHGMWR
ncbi:CotD family spore coat protein [Rummeliibacillus pycnus]|uniref:CotD family spore coat protein n=1 Tax=Rummeliibacillus pycnus TaxID=101070 RepID=UPI00389ADE8D